MMQVKIDEFSIAYEDHGSGIPILLIHGYPLNRQIWQAQILGLSKSVRLISLDLRNHGESKPNAGCFSEPSTYTMDLMAEDCLKLLDAIEVSQPVILCGLSMGGYISFAFYRKYPERVAGLILAATRASADSLEGNAKRDAAIDLALSQGVDRIVENMLPIMLSPKAYDSQPELVRQVKAIMQSSTLNGVIGDLAGMKERPDSTPMLSQIDRHTLILYGEDDQIIPLAEMEALQSSIPGSRLVIIPEAGHLLNMEQPETFNQAVQDFLETLGGEKI